MVYETRGDIWAGEGNSLLLLILKLIVLLEIVFFLTFMLHVYNVRIVALYRCVYGV